MARKRKSKKYSRRRGSRMSGTGKGDVMTIVSAVAGAVAGRILSAKVLPNANDKLKAGGQIAVGVLLPRFAKNPFFKGFGMGMVVNGGVQLLSSFGVISGIAGMGEDITVERLGYQDESISGSSDIQVISGDYEGEDMGYYDEGVMSGSADISILSGDMEDYDY